MSHFLHWPQTATFTRNVNLPLNNEVSTNHLYPVSFFALIPLQRLFDYGGRQMSYYLGKSLGELLLITLNKSVPTCSLRKRVLNAIYLVWSRRRWLSSYCKDASKWCVLASHSLFWFFIILLQAAAPESNDCWRCHPTSPIGSGDFICYGRSSHTPARPPSTREWAQSFFANSWVSKIYFMLYVRWHVAAKQGIEFIASFCFFCRAWYRVFPSRHRRWGIQ